MYCEKCWRMTDIGAWKEGNVRNKGEGWSTDDLKIIQNICIGSDTVKRDEVSSHHCTKEWAYLRTTFLNVSLYQDTDYGSHCQIVTMTHICHTSSILNYFMWYPCGTHVGHSFSTHEIITRYPWGTHNAFINSNPLISKMVQQGSNCNPIGNQVPDFLWVVKDVLHS